MCVQSSTTSVITRNLPRTPNVRIMLIQGRPFPLTLCSIIPPLSEKHVTKSIGKTIPLHPPKFLMTFILVIDRFPGCTFPIRGHPFMTSTRRGQAQVDACGRGWGGQASCGRPQRKLQLESTDVILSSSHAKKLVYFLPEFLLWTE